MESFQDRATMQLARARALNTAARDDDLPQLQVCASVRLSRGVSWQPLLPALPPSACRRPSTRARGAVAVHVATFRRNSSCYRALALGRAATLRELGCLSLHAAWCRSNLSGLPHTLVVLAGAVKRRIDQCVGPATATATRRCCWRLASLSHSSRSRRDVVVSVRRVSVREYVCVCMYACVCS
jgi:hypothetical protein